MIRLELKDYCHDCVGFEAEVKGPDRYFSGVEEVARTDTIVTCTHRERCANAVKYVMEGYKENASRNT